jgi:hypothetical protein
MSVAAHRQAAANAVANLQSIANSVTKNVGPSDSKPAARPMDRKRKAGSDDGGDSGGYNTDDERNDNDRNSNDVKSFDGGSVGSVDSESNRWRPDLAEKKKKAQRRGKEKSAMLEKGKKFPNFTPDRRAAGPFVERWCYCTEGNKELYSH